MRRLYINPEYRQLLLEAGLDSYEALYGNELPGELLDEEIDRTTRRLSLGGQTFYFKRMYKASPRKSLEVLLRFRLPHHYGWRDMQELGYLRDAGFPVAKVVAAGEETRWGVPVASFVLTSEVPGVGLDSVVAETDITGRSELMARLGQLTARLHLAGFFTAVRQKDVICDEDGAWVLIDRETRYPGAHRFTSTRAFNALERTFRRERENTLGWDEASLAAYCASYRSTISPRWQVSTEELRQVCRPASLQ